MKQYKRPEITTGDQNKPVSFFIVAESSGPEAHEGGREQTLFQCMADVYESSMKDIERNSMISAKNLITMKIRDTFGEYIPKTDHQFRIEHYNYPGTYNIVDISFDTKDGPFIKIVGEYHG